MKQPLITIVTATFNIETFVEKAVLSVLNQTYPSIEYIVVDGGSSDKTLEILKKYESRINLISEKDRGLYDALNKGFKMAKGEILTWLDADNFYLSNDVIEKIAQEFSQDESPDLVVVNTETRFSDNWKSVFNFPPKNLSFDLLLNQGNKLVPEGVFFRKSLFEKAGGLDIQYKLLADYELWLKMFKLKPKFKKIEMASAVFSVRNDALLRKDPFLAWRETYLIGTKYGWSWLKRFHFFLRYFIERLRFFLAPAWRKIISKK